MKEELDIWKTILIKTGLNLFWSVIFNDSVVQVCVRVLRQYKYVWLIKGDNPGNWCHSIEDRCLSQDRSLKCFLSIVVVAWILDDTAWSCFCYWWTSHGNWTLSTASSRWSQTKSSSSSYYWTTWGMKIKILQAKLCCRFNQCWRNYAKWKEETSIHIHKYIVIYCR